MTGNYYDLDSILADGERIPCRFNMSVPGLGYLEGNPGKPIDQGTKIELPLWLAEILAICELSHESQLSFIDLSEPEFMSPKVTNAVKTGPTSIDLHKLLGHYYTLAEKWCTFFSEPQLIETIMFMFKERAAHINNYASNTNKQMNNNFLYTLDEFEKYLYKLTSEANREMRKWLQNWISSNVNVIL